MGAHIEMSLLLLLLLPTMPTHKGDCFDMNTFGEFRTPSSSPPIVVSDGAIRIIPAARADRLNVCTPHLFQVDRLRYVFYFILFYFIFAPGGKSGEPEKGETLVKPVTRYFSLILILLAQHRNSVTCKHLEQLLVMLFFFVLPLTS